jgi:hypothetical protein
MDITHAHLLLNHVPTIGFGIGLFLFLWALISKSQDLTRASLVVLTGVALLTIPTYWTGNGAAETICPGMDPGGAGTTAEKCQDATLSKELIQTHEGAAFLALVVIQLTGAFAWLGLWQFRRFSAPRKWNIVLILLLAILSMALVAKAANIGGEIRHVEIRAPQDIGTPADHYARRMGLWITGAPYGWPALETLHFMGLTLLIGVVLLVDFRILGMMKQASFSAIHRLIPWAVLGFAINTLTGMFFFVASPAQYAHNIAFIWKICLLILAGANAFYFTLFDEVWDLKPGDEAPAMAKFMSVAAIVLWIGVLYFGSMLPFLGNAF